MLITFLSLICLPTYQGFNLYPSEFIYLVFGELSNMEKFYLSENDTDPENITDPSNVTLGELLSNDAYYVGDPKAILEGFKNPIDTISGPDKNVFDKVNYNFYNFTRKQNPNWDNWSLNYGAYDADERHKHWIADRHQHEINKIIKVNQLGLQLLIHTRYKLAGAMKTRARLRVDKRYKLGYLFNRLRRIKTEMLRMIALAYEHFTKDSLKKVMVLLKIYEEVVHMDIDIRDTMRLITDLFARDSPSEYLVETTTVQDGPDYMFGRK